MLKNAWITKHAIDRWQERVDRSASRREARLAIGRIVAMGRWRDRPRHWMTESPTGPGTRFVYLAACPGVCVVVKDGVAVTVVTRKLAQAVRRDRAVGSTRPRPTGRPRLYLVTEDWSWDDDEDFEDAA